MAEADFTEAEVEDSSSRHLGAIVQDSSGSFIFRFRIEADSETLPLRGFSV
jgi:hypothetical protein